MSIGLLEKCYIVSNLKSNLSDFMRVRSTLENFRSTYFCPNNIRIESVEYLLGLLGIKQLDLVFYNNTIDSQNALAHNEADFDAYSRFIDEQTIVVSEEENVAFVAPFEQSSICLVQSINVMLQRVVQFDDKFWIAPYNAACWMIILSLLAVQHFCYAFRLRLKNRFFKLAITHTDASIGATLAAFATFMYLPQLRSDTASIQQYKIPYKTAESFADAVIRRQARPALVNNSFIFHLLMTHKLDLLNYSLLGNTYGYNYLAQALQRNLSNAIIYQSWEHACRELLSHDIKTFALLHEFTAKSCSAKVVNQLQITCFDDAPTKQVALLFSAKSRFIENASRLAEFIRIQQSRYFLQNDKVFAPDIPTAYVKTGISTTSLQLLFMIYFALLAFALIVCVLEILIAAKL